MDELGADLGDIATNRKNSKKDTSWTTSQRTGRVKEWCRVHWTRAESWLAHTQARSIGISRNRGNTRLSQGLSRTASILNHTCVRSKCESHTRPHSSIIPGIIQGIIAGNIPSIIPSTMPGSIPA
eukprot:4680925-Alexandrium_andersonii.AAC.1